MSATGTTKGSKAVREDLECFNQSTIHDINTGLMTCAAAGRVWPVAHSKTNSALQQLYTQLYTVAASACAVGGWACWWMTGRVPGGMSSLDSSVNAPSVELSKLHMRHYRVPHGDAVAFAFQATYMS
jgi:hypothetical protein